MKRRDLVAVCHGIVALALVHCGPSASGTKTNWFRACDRDADCDQELSCNCGICTLSCAEDAGCEEGHCATVLESSAQCGVAGAERMCVPTSDTTCAEYPLEADPELGNALTPSCAAEGALACEGFDAPLSPEYGTWQEAEMSAVIQNCEVHGGDGAMHYESGAPGMTQTRIRLPEAIASGPLHARFFVRLAAEMVLPEQLQLFEFWETDGPDVPNRIAVFVTAEGVPHVYVGVSETTLAPTAPSPLSRDTWVCLELSLDLQAESGAAALGLDGTTVISSDQVATQPTEPFTVAVIEAQPTDDTAGVDLYVDDLVIATAPIGCQ